MTTITRITTRDARFPLEEGAGSDAVHNINIYSYPITELHSDAGIQGSGIVLTLAGGNELVCRLIEQLAAPLVGREIEELMADFGRIAQKHRRPSTVSLAGPAQRHGPSGAGLHSQCLL